MIHNAGLELHVWTVDNLTRMQQLIDLGVDGITTNAPHTMRSIVPLPGDFNRDNTMNASDYVVWRNTMGDSESLATWRANFGRTVGVAPGAGAAVGNAASVPEAGTLGLAIMLMGQGVLVRSRGARSNRSRSGK
jgi:hypothetical protein